MQKGLSLLLLFFLIWVNCSAQSGLTVTADSSATMLAQTIAGSGVIVSNASLNCSGQAVANFSYSGSNLGLTNGIILSTGIADSAIYHPSSFYSPPSYGFGTTYTDPNLTAIEATAINDVCIVAFDFVPVCNSLSITFVFASSEYDGFVCEFNDAFGIFLTGPNPAGGNYTAQNIATLPGGTPVSINNVNDGNLNDPTCQSSNSNYFVNNLNSTTLDNVNQDIAYPGYTIPITSVTSVSPCTSYHMEIAIADAGDDAYDSGVFIQGNSISCTNTPTITATETNVNCGVLGSATVTVTNYTGTPTYTWQPGGATTASVNNLTPGTYSCAVGLQLACGFITQTVTTVVGSSGTAFNYTTTSQNPLCDNGTNGSAGVIVGGGVTPYTYTWTTIPPQTGANATNLAAGTYSVNITDNIGCIGTTTVVLTNPPPIIATVTTSPTTCTGSTGIATAYITSGGTAPYTYVWNTTPPQTGPTINNLAQGTYTVGVLDVNSCTATATGVISIQGFTWTAAATSTNPLCNGAANGSATVNITNPGLNTFTYSWSTTPAQTTSVSANLSAGVYSVVVTDNNGCSGITTTTLTNPPPITATVNTSPTICSGSVGSATATVLSGGTGPYNYTWVTNPAQVGSVCVNLAQGSYSVVVIDVNNCSSIATGSVQSTGFTWVPVATASPVKCYGYTDGTATVTITNPGASTFTSYVWTPSAQTNSVATNLAVGNYTVTVTDNNSCVSTTHVSITQPNQMVLGTYASPAICTSNSGKAFVTIFGGTSPYTPVWQTTPPQTGITAIDLAQGQYNVTVTDANNCIATTTVLVKDTNDLTLTASSSPDLCSKGVGLATAHPSGGQPFTYMWLTNPAQSKQTADSLTAGSYSVNVTDNYGCTASASTIVSNKNDMLDAEFIITPPGTVYAENPVILNMIPNSGWIADSLAFLSNGVLINKNPFSYIFPQYGNYTATYYFTSIHGCKDSATYDILVKDYMTLYIPNSFTPNGDGKNDHFEAEGTFINSFQMNIYDRWGILVTTLNNITNTWDGTKNGGPAPSDTYVYKGTASDIFGNLLSFKGQINLIR